MINMNSNLKYASLASLIVGCTTAQYVFADTDSIMEAPMAEQYQNSQYEKSSIIPATALAAVKQKAIQQQKSQYTSPVYYKGLSDKPVYIPSLDVTTRYDKDKQLIYTVDGIDFTLTQDDKVIARNWNLNAEDWVKYKYIMKYMPRGNWTPGLDPLLALGNLSKDTRDQARYARIENDLQINRQKREAAFADMGQQVVPKVEKPKATGRITGKLGGQYKRLKTLFVDMKSCDNSCILFVTRAVISTSANTKLNIVATGGTNEDLMQLLIKAGSNEKHIQKMNFNLNAEEHNPDVSAYSDGGTVPYYILQDDVNTHIKHIHR